MRFLIRPHQGKELPYLQALLAAGHVQSLDAEVVLIDFEIPHSVGDRKLYVKHAQEKGAALCAYPHGFAVVGEHQLTREPYECAAAFVHGPGQKQLREAYGYPNPVHAVGYPLSRKPLEPREPNRVVFAPHHPLGSGWMPEDARRANTEAFRTLLASDYALTVRVIGSLEQNGLWEETGVRYVYAQMDGSTTEGDVAVAGGTYLANCLARGIPVVAYNQERDWRVELEGKEPERVPDWQMYEGLTRYPIDLSDPGAIETAAHDPGAVSDWMANFMPPFEPERFASLVEETCRSPVS